jgi:hypothetical protein
LNKFILSVNFIFQMHIFGFEQENASELGVGASAEVQAVTGGGFSRRRGA